jgi:tetratricopeptide (TPR) repeat protein
MLTLIREYAATKVENLAALRQRHADYYLKLAREWGSRVTSRYQEEALARLELEQANLEAALHWVDETQNWKMVAEFVVALSDYAYTRGRITPFVFDLVRRAVVALESTGDTASLAALLYALGGMAWIRHEYAEAEACATTALKFFRAHEMHSRACHALSLLGLIALDRDQHAMSRARFREGLQICDECGLRLEKVVILQNLSMLELQAGNDEEAERLAMQGIDINRELGDDVGRSYQLHTLALVAWRRGDRDAAASLFEESLDIRESLGDHPGLATTFRELGRILATAGQPRDGARLLFAARRLENGSLLPFTPAHQETLEEVTRLVSREEIAALQSSVTEATLTDLAADARTAIGRLPAMDGPEARP